MAGKVVGIFIAGKKEKKPKSVKSVETAAHRGLVGDRYFANSGTFSDAEPHGPGREITLIEEESVDLLSEALHQKVDPALLRRNILTKGIHLNDLVGQKFTVGNIKLVGVRLCHPCAHLQRLSGWQVTKYLKQKGGLRADILDNGRIRVGDTVTILLDDPPEINPEPLQ
jgi:MOSC domain-containing protein YiiM